MFTGIITDIGQIKAIEPRGDLRVIIATAYDTSRPRARRVGGVLGRLPDGGGEGRRASSASMSRAKPPAARPVANGVAGRRLNLERALKVGDELGGHIVTGHVDAVGRITSVTPVGNSTRIAIQVPKDIAPFVAPKGSICLDGVSLTVNMVADNDEGADFTINIIPHTAAWTTFDTVKAGDELNIEIDVLARYLARMKQSLAD